MIHCIYTKDNYAGLMKKSARSISSLLFEKYIVLLEYISNLSLIIYDSTCFLSMSCIT